MKKSIVTIGVLVAFVTFLVSFVYGVQSLRVEVAKTEAEAPPIIVEKDELEIAVKEIEAEPVIEIYEATIAAVGDILISGSINTDVRQKDGSYDFTPIFEHVKPFIHSADLAFANQETILGGIELGLSGYPLFNSPFEVGDALLDNENSSW